jgi:hypothetical protein
VKAIRNATTTASESDYFARSRGVHVRLIQLDSHYLGTRESRGNLSMEQHRTPSGDLTFDAKSWQFLPIGIEDAVRDDDSHTLSKGIRQGGVSGTSIRSLAQRRGLFERIRQYAQVLGDLAKFSVRRSACWSQECDRCGEHETDASHVKSPVGTEAKGRPTSKLYETHTSVPPCARTAPGVGEMAPNWEHWRDAVRSR